MEEQKKLDWNSLFNSVEGTPVAVAKISYEKDILDCSTHFAFLLGLDRVEAKTKNVERDITLFKDRETTNVRFDMIEHGEHIATMKRYKKKDGSTILCFIVAIPMDGWILDFMHEVNEYDSELDREIEKLNAIIESYKQLLTSNREVNITMTQESNNQENYADHGASINTGTQVSNDANVVVNSLKWILIPLALLIAYGFYYISTVATNTTPEKPDMNILSPGDNGNDEISNGNGN